MRGVATAKERLCPPYEAAVAGPYCQNIENNPMQSSRGLPAFDTAT
ncbi:hypothetical protein ABIE91_002852 [Bradyrhizobium elkanii]